MDFEKAKLNPAAVFKSPQEVFSSQELSLEQKIEILRRWEQDARLMEVAAEESMPGPQPKLLQPIRDALHALNYIGRIPSTRAPAKPKNRTAISRDELTHSAHRFGFFADWGAT
jgi:hypothetical protein